MASEEKKKRDFWDILEIIGRLFNALVIALLGIAVTVGTNKITTSLKYGDLTQKMISDLSSTDQKGKIASDLSLLTLNRIIGDDNPALVVEIADRIYKNDSVRSDESSTALNILLERAPGKAMKYKQEAREMITKNRNNVISSPESHDTTASPVKSVTPGQQSIINSISKALRNRIYIQTNQDKQNLVPLRKSLQEMGFEVPEIEMIHKPFTASVRYFNLEDAGNAENILSLCVKMFPGKNIRIIKLQNKDNQVPVGQIEVWISQ